MTSGVSVSETSVATRSPDREAERRVRADLLDGADEHAAGAGLGVLHLAAGGDDVEHLGADARVDRRRRACARSSWRYDAASRLSRSTRIRTSSGHSSARVSSRWAACGSTTGVVEDPVQAGRITVTGGHGGGSSVDSGVLDRKILRRGIGRAAHSPRTLSAHEHRDRHRPGRPASPTPTAGSSWSSPTGPASPAGRTSPPSEWASVQWQRAHCVKNVKQLRELMGDLLDERFYADLERDQAERATMSMLVPPQMMNTMAPRDEPAGPGSLTDAFYADPIRHYMIPVFSRPAHRLVLAPARHPRLAARARHVGGRGAHPPLPHQGAGRAAADLPAVLRPLHPDGPGRQLHRRSSTS